MLICPMLTIFHFDFVSDYHFKMSKVGRWASFLARVFPIMMPWGFSSIHKQCHSLQYHKYYLLLWDPNHHTFTERCLRNHYIIVRMELTPWRWKWWFSTSLSCQSQVGGHIVYIKGIPMMSLLGKHHDTDNYDFYSHQYWLCNIDFPVAKIIILGRKCIVSSVHLHIGPTQFVLHKNF